MRATTVFPVKSKTGQRYWPLILLAVVVSFSCKKKSADTLFTLLESKHSGITFNNRINDQDSSISFINEFGYMGGGVGIGDFNNDGLKDIFFTGSQVSAALYLNQGNNSLVDITAKAGVITKAWCTGVSIVDINNDGYDDIYVCVLGKGMTEKSPNLLFINQHDLTFKEEAAAYGLADLGNSTQAAFLDYDKDGDLDMYLNNYLLSTRNANDIYPRDRSGFSPANDKLFRNDGDSLQKGHPVFTDVSLQAGIKEDGYGLGIVVSDFNGDNYPDIYVANDFVSNDILWLNNQDGSFTNCISQSVNHQSYSSMGVDAADINNDTLADIVTLDMLPELNTRRKTSVSFMHNERYLAEREMGYEPAFVRNMLQLNMGLRLMGDKRIPYFSEIGQLSGIDATDWSWSVLLADFNCDGWKDMHITNGIGRDFIHGDFLEFSSSIFSSNLSREEQERKIRQKISGQKPVELPNYLFLNNKGLIFSDHSAAGGINKKAISNGAASVDLDNDGDLDLVVNNINSEAFVFLNNTFDNRKESKTHSLRIQLKNAVSQNQSAFGAKLFLYSGGLVQMLEQNPVRGYFSSVDQRLFFGLGENIYADSLRVIWPDGKTTVMHHIKADTLLTLFAEQANFEPEPKISMPPFLFQDITGESGISYKHTEVPYNDFAYQRLLPQKYSQQGPYIATGDINGDKRTDFFIGGGARFTGQIFKQLSLGSFERSNLTDSLKLPEDADCLFFDADIDGDQDLLVTYGDIQFADIKGFHSPKLFLNDGKGVFIFKADAIPDSVMTIAGSVSSGDFDSDGDPDLFIGGRVSQKYPLAARSFILENNKGKFKDITATVCPSLQLPGMVTSSVCTDFNGDGSPDLVIAGEWMDIRFFVNHGGKLVEITKTTGLKHISGMWRSLIAADADNDGDMDFIAGNLGLNCMYKVTASEPMEMFSADLDGNGSIDPILFYYIKDKDGKRRSFPAISRGLFAEQVPSIKRKFLRYNDYANADFQTVFKGMSKEKIMRLYCDETRSCYIENAGNGKFIKHPLPVEAQFAPVNAIICEDLDMDGFKDILIAGNEYQAEVLGGRYDASYGSFLKGTAAKTFSIVPGRHSGFSVQGDVKDMDLIMLADGSKRILVAANNDSLRVFKVMK